MRIDCQKYRAALRKQADKNIYINMQHACQHQHNIIKTCYTRLAIMISGRLGLACLAYLLGDSDSAANY
jgi:hypothetical protein